jgi:hypothetical protein
MDSQPGAFTVTQNRELRQDSPNRRDTKSTEDHQNLALEVRISPRVSISIG